MVWFLRHVAQLQLFHAKLDNTKYCSTHINRRVRIVYFWYMHKQRTIGIAVQRFKVHVAAKITVQR